ncbi:MAG: hypothetical protein IPN23_10635 [Elusimicrobia bacterium]|nr:hypothetical protein [Elusimicrobiota bacterium]
MNDREPLKKKECGGVRRASATALMPSKILVEIRVFFALRRARSKPFWGGNDGKLNG